MNELAQQLGYDIYFVNEHTYAPCEKGVENIGFSIRFSIPI
jgi:hypothetical protein